MLDIPTKKENEMSEIYKISKWNNNEIALFLRIADRLDFLGYDIISQPLMNQFDSWIDCLQTGIDKLEEHIKDIRKVYNYRGYSKPLLAHLHTKHKSPSFGIALKIK